VTHESNAPDTRVTLWESGDDRALAARTLRGWRSRGGDLAGDVNYAHLPRARAYLDTGRDVKIVAMRRERAATIASYARWTEPGGAEGSVKSRDHWRQHGGEEHQFDEWDLTFPKYDAAKTKLDGIAAYYDAYDAALRGLARDYGAARVRVFESPALFDDANLQRELFAFLGLAGAAPVTGVHANAQTYA
jgi:hypothetical protein